VRLSTFKISKLDHKSCACKDGFAEGMFPAATVVRDCHESALH
jgi:hypothetical protein